MKEVYVAKNVSIKHQNFLTILGYAQGKRLSFSRALNEIIAQWDKISIEFTRLESEKQSEQLHKAKIIKPSPKIEVQKCATK